jgi:hypothetical protein
MHLASGGTRILSKSMPYKNIIQKVAIATQSPNTPPPLTHPRALSTECHVQHRRRQAWRRALERSTYPGPFFVPRNFWAAPTAAVAAAIGLPRGQQVSWLLPRLLQPEFCCQYRLPQRLAGNAQSAM